MPVVEVNDVWKRFRLGHARSDSLRDLLPGLFASVFKSRGTKRDFWALRELSFTMERGETLGVIGPNGAGKSTLLKILTKILAPNRGTVRTQGRVSALIEIGAGFHPDLTGRENVFLNGAILGIPRRRIREKLDSIVEFSGLSQFIDTQVKRYSSGMFARLGFSVAANLDPDILLVDEVLAVGDFWFRRKCYEHMIRRAGGDLTVLFVSHNFEAVRSICKKTLLIANGRPEFIGPTDEAIERFMHLAKEMVGGLNHRPDTPIIVNRVWLENSTGEEVDVAKAQQRYAVAVEVEAKESISNPVIGFYLRAKDHLRLADASTRMFNVDTGTLRTGETKTVRFPLMMHLLPDDYFLGAYIEPSDGSATIERHPTATAFRVFGDACTLGLMDLDIGCATDA
jgi:lipopolysaccharide transport system ATP-binding protein